MKTEVKFRELPEKVQGFLMRMFGVLNSIGLDWLHNLPEWSQATDDERLAYAEWRYKDGVRYNYPDAPWLGDRTAQGLIRIGKDSNIVDDIFTIYEHEKNKWAEIISEPEEKQSIKDRLKGTCVKNESAEMGAEIIALYVEAGFQNKLNLKGTKPDLYYGVFVFGDGPDIGCFSKSDFTSVLTLDQLRQIVRGSRSVEQYEKELEEKFIHEASPEAQQEFVKANPGMQHVEEPKAGDMVEVLLPRGEWADNFYFTGGKSKDDNYIVQDWAGDLFEYDRIRLPQKSEVESKVEELANKFTLYDGSDGNYTLVSLHEVKEAMLSMAKWGQANHGKI